MNVLIEGAVVGLLGNLLTELAGSVRRRLSDDAVRAALRAALSEALETALKDAGLSPEDFDHSESFFRDLFKEEAVLAEMVQLLDPRPDRTLDFEKLAAELEEAGLDPKTLPGFELESFLRNFAVAFYSPAGKQEALRGILDLKLLGEVAVGVRTIAQWSERGALASERTADGMERLTGEVEELNGNIQRFLQGGVSEAALRGAVLALQAAGLIPAFDGWRVVESTLLRSGYDIDIDKEGRLKIAGQPSEGRALPPAQLDTLRNLAVDLRHAIAARSPNEAELDALADRYRQHIIRWFHNLTFHGMTPSARAIELPLEEVYVELRAVAEVPEAADSFSVEERRLLLEAEDKDLEAKRELLSQLDAFRRERWGRTLPERKSIAAALYQKDRRAFVILGDPGSGKSTLLHFLALVHAQGAEVAGKRLGIDPSEADRLPILVPLAAFDDMLRETPGLTLLDFLPRFYDRRRGLPGLGPLFRRALETGRALVLLDGLDEVLDTATRGYVTQQASAMIGEWSPRGVRFAVSSRFVGYREAPVPGNLPTLSVLDFGEKEIEIFVHRWSHAYEKWSAGGEETPEMLRKARELEKDLLDDVKSNESVRRLAANPLMITLLALLRRQVGRLPHRRVQLYEAYVSTMLDNWIEARSQGAREKSIPALDRHQAENILIPLALWLQREKPSGTAGGAELERQLTDICLEDKGTARESATRPQLREAEEHARRFLKEMRETTGLLIARGHDAFGFLHLTFQEYFAGRALARLEPEERWSLLRPHLHDPRWREPILLCAGRLGVVENRRKEVTDLVRRILGHEDLTEMHLRRNLLLALAIACDDVNLERLLLEDLMDAAVQSLSNKVNAFRVQVLSYLAQLTAEGETKARLERCFAVVWTSKDVWFQMLAVQALGRFAENPGIRDILLSKLEDQSREVRSAAVEGLGGVVEREERIRRAILSKIDDDHDVCSAAVRSLAGLLADDEEVRIAISVRLGFNSGVALEAQDALLPYASLFRAALLSKIEELDKLPQRWSIVSLASTLLGSDEELRSKVLSLLEQGEDPLIRSSALEALSGLVGDRLEVSAAFIKAAKDSDLAEHALAGLAPVLDRIEGAREVALACLQHEDEWVRVSAVDALSRFVGFDQILRNAVLKRFADPSEWVRSASAQALAPHIDGPEIRVAFRELAESGSWQDRMSVAKIIGERSASEEDFSVLRSIRDNDNAPEASWFLAQSIGAISEFIEGREVVLAYLNDARSIVRSAAAQTLVNRAKADPTVHAALVTLLDDEEPDVWAVLSPLVEWDRNVRSKILDRIGDPKETVRLAALRSLSSSVGKDEKVDAAVLRRVDDNKYAVRGLATVALMPLFGRSQEARRAILKRLDGPEPYAWQSAAQAVSALAEDNQEIQRAILDRLEVDLGYRSVLIEALSGSARSNLEVRNRILRELRDERSPARDSAIIALGGLAAEDKDIRSLILHHVASSEPGIPESAIRALSPLVGTDAEVKATLLARVDDSRFSVRLHAVNALTTLDSAQLQREDLWGRLEPWLAVDVGPSDPYLDSMRTTLASVFGSRLITDQDLRDRIVALLQSLRWSARLGALLTLAAWPGGPPQEIVKRIFQALNDQRGLESYPARLMAASFLINRNEDAQESILLCMEALDYGTQPWELLANSTGVRKQAALVLGKLEPLAHNQRVYDRLLKVMKEDQNSDVRDAAYNALVRLAGVRDRQAAVA